MKIFNILHKLVTLYNGLPQHFSTGVQRDLSVGTLISVRSALLPLQLGKTTIFTMNWHLN